MRSEESTCFSTTDPSSEAYHLGSEKTLRGPSIQRDRRDPSLMSGSYGASASACAFKARQAPASSGLRGHLSPGGRSRQPRALSDQRPL